MRRGLLVCPPHQSPNEPSPLVTPMRVATNSTCPPPARADPRGAGPGPSRRAAPRSAHDAIAVDHDRHAADTGVVDHQPEVDAIRGLTACHHEIGDLFHVALAGHPQLQHHRPSLTPRPIRAPVAVPDGVSIFVVRHAKAGSRHKWDGDDRERPLSGRGRRQAETIGKRLLGERVTGLYSSPYVRCVQTLELLCEHLSLDVVADDRLAEGVGVEQALDLLTAVGDGAVLCSHGDIILDLVGALSAAAPNSSPRRTCSRGRSASSTPPTATAASPPPPSSRRRTTDADH